MPNPHANLTIDSISFAEESCVQCIQQVGKTRFLGIMALQKKKPQHRLQLQHGYQHQEKELSIIPSS